MTWRETKRRLHEDRTRIQANRRGRNATGAYFLRYFPCYLCVWLYRLSHYFYKKGCVSVSRFLWQSNLYLTGADISPLSDIGGGLLIPHPAGVSIDTTAGKNLTVMALSGIGPPFGINGHKNRSERVPILGNNVFLSHHAGIYASVTIGDDVYISPGCVITDSVHDNVTMVGETLRLRHLPI